LIWGQDRGGVEDMTNQEVFNEISDALKNLSGVTYELALVVKDLNKRLGKVERDLDSLIVKVYQDEINRAMNKK
jgi:hypothetical protein